MSCFEGGGQGFLASEFRKRGLMISTFVQNFENEKNFVLPVLTGGFLIWLLATLAFRFAGQFFLSQIQQPYLLVYI